MTKQARRELMVECACFDLRKASRAVSRLYDEFMRGARITGTQFSMLRLILVERELSVTTLGRYMVMDRTSVRRALDPLERDGLISVRQGEDQRVRIVRLTKKGRQTVEQAEQGWRRAQEALMDAIGPERWLSLRTLLREATNRVRHRDDDVRQGDKARSAEAKSPSKAGISKRVTA